MKPYLVLNVGLLTLVEVDFEEPGAIKPDAGSLSNDLSRVDKVIENGGVDSNQGARPEAKEHQVLNFKTEEFLS